MSKIDKLSVLGIRSFDNQRSETIQFLSPLTLVVGYNGSGKTTIIECLKFATTGIQPPNSKGGAFIHDPKLCGEKEVLAQVKLSFTASTGARMVATRSLQLTVKKTTRSQKTLEGQLLMVKDGERTAISSRVAELDMILPQYLGVSRAVLDNVIFCHQDESLWPMSEPASLKKKFDEIFEALKYTKAIDNIKQLRKKQNEELAKFKILEQHAKEDKDKSERAEKRSRQLHDEIESFREECNELSGRIKQAAELADKAWREAESYSKILGALEGKRIEARSKEATINDLSMHLKEVPESDEWLESSLEQFESRMAQYEEQKLARQEEYLGLRGQLEELRRELSRMSAERGKHEHDKDDHDRNINRRKEMIREVAALHSMRGYDDLIDDTQVEDFMFKIRKISKDHNTALDKARREAETEKRDGQSLINRLVERKKALQDSKVSSKRQMALNDREAGEYQARVNQINVDEGSKAVIESRIEDVGNRMQKAKQVAAKADWDSSIKTANGDLRALEDDVSRLNDEIIQGTKKAGEMARLAHLKQELKERCRGLETLTNAHGDRIKKLVVDDWQPSSVEGLHQNALEEATRELAAAERVRDLVTKELEQLQYKQKLVRDDIAQKNKEFRDYEQLIRAAIDEEPSEFPEVLNERQSRYDMKKDDIGQFAGMTDYLSKLLSTATGPSPSCRACQRPFRNETELSKFKTRMQDLIRKAEADAGEDEVKELEVELQKARDVSLAYETWKKLSVADLPALKKEQSTFSELREVMLAKIESHDKIVETKLQAKKELEQLSRTIASIAKCFGDIKAFEMQIADLTAKQSQQGGGRTLEDIQEEIVALQDKIRVGKSTTARLTSEKDQSRTDLSAMELEQKDLENQQNTIAFQLEKKATNVARVEEYKALNQKQRDVVDKLDADIEKLEPEIATAQAKYEDIMQRTASQEQELQRETALLSNSVNELNLLNGQITSYLDRGGATQLANVKREIKNGEREVSRIESEQGEISVSINKLGEQLRDSENTRRQYSDNLRYRQESRALEKLRGEISELAAQNAEVDRDRFKEESTKRTHEHHKLTAKQAGIIGEMKAKDVQLLQLVADYETDFKDAPQRFKEAHIKVETTKAVVEDLGRYGGALDKAIMKYHSLKMEEINRIIEELWQRTYQGTDVDTILIKSEGETGRGNRSYNYRVCMVKQDVEMDMRGRCSAGQKVLASIIIRLALAECFGVNCGLIALDEPTTNLDRDNIRSLAESLHDIIKHRQQQSNFQLIVITHDEEFLRHMQCGDFSDYYYRVSRNERQKSIIERQSIHEVM